MARSDLVAAALLAASLFCVLLGRGLPGQGAVNRTLLRAPAGEGARPTGPAATVEACRPSVVHVYVEIDGPRGEFKIERGSSGVVVDASGLVLTWKHLVEEVVGADDKQLFVQLDDSSNSRLLATIVRLDEPTGLALLRIAPPAGGLSAAELGPDRPRSGEGVVVLARPEGKDMLAFAGVASPALADVAHHGCTHRAADLFLTDSRNDERCDGAPIFDEAGRLLGLYGAEHVQRDKSEPTLEDLRRPSFGIAVPAGVVRSTFRAEFAERAVKNATLRRAPAPAASPAAEAVAAAAESVVAVWCGEGDGPDLGTEDPGAVQRRAGFGSGVVIASGGLVVTNAHLVGSGEPRIRTRDGRTFDAEVVRTNGVGNLALLRVELPAGAKLRAAACAPDGDAIVGETVIAIGNPLGTQAVVSRGVVSAIRGRGGSRIQADANLGNANAGGAVIDVTGRLLGVVDGGAIDPLEVAFAMRGDRATTETNLSTFVGIRAVRRAFQREIEAAAGADEPIRTPVAGPPKLRATPLTAMVDEVSGAMLNIYIARNVAVPDPEDPFASMAEPKLVTMSLGSGVIIDSSGLALSNWHVVDAAVGPDGAPRPDHVVTARVFGGRKYDVRVLSISRENDLSLLQLELPPGETVDAVELGNSDALALGEAVAAIGNPHGRANSVTYGVVSATGQGIRVKGRWAKLEHLIETDAAINGGNSGGALLDMNGRLVGINSAGGGTFNNVGYAIAVNHVRNTVMGLMLQAYKLRSPDLGLRVIDQDGKVLVMDVDDRGPAARAGIRGGDRVVSLAGVDITWSPGFARTLLQQRPGEELDFVVERDGERRTIAVAPLPNPVWSVVRQSFVEVRAFDFRENPARARAAAIGLHRELTGDPNAAPPQIPAEYVAVERVFAAQAPWPIELEAGDLVLAVELRDAATGNPVQQRIASVEALRDLFNDRELGSYDGVEWKLWIARGDEVRSVTATAKRLLW